MTDRLLERIRAAVEGGDPIPIAALDVASRVEVRRAARLLSVSLDLPTARLAELLTLLWPESTDPDTAVAELLDWSFVQVARGHCRMAPSVAKALALAFREEDTARFVDAHRRLYQAADVEAVDTGAGQGWFVGGRKAFYLAGISQAQSVREFTTAFTEPPPSEKVNARMWLTSLALHQEALLDDHDRELQFFRGFRAYVTGRNDEARKLLEGVHATAGEDRVAAIAAHLLGLLVEGADLRRATRLYRESIEMSSALSLDVNEVMARNSLVWAHVKSGQARPANAKREFRTAARLAEENQGRAQETGDDQLIWWTDYAYVATSIIEWTDGGRGALGLDHVSAADEMGDRAARLADDAFNDGDYTRALHASNQSAEALRELERYDLALSVIEEAIERAPRASREAVEHLAQTTGSILGRIGRGPVRARATRLLADLDVRKEDESSWSRTSPDEIY